jgi:hypothetical protein
MALYKISLSATAHNVLEAIAWCEETNIACVTMPSLNSLTRIPTRCGPFVSVEFIFESENDATMFLLKNEGKLKEIKNGKR